MGEAAPQLHGSALDASSQLLYGQYGLSEETLDRDQAARVIPLPVSAGSAEARAAATPIITPETVVLSAALIKHKLDTRNSSMAIDRITDLLTLAWRGGDVPNIHPVPAYLLPFITDNPTDWYREHQERIEEMILAAKIGKGTQAFKLEVLREDTEKYETSPFLRHAVRIYTVSQKHPEALRVEVAARQIIADADEEFRQ